MNLFCWYEKSALLSCVYPFSFLLFHKCLNSLSLYNRVMVFTCLYFVFSYTVNLCKVKAETFFFPRLLKSKHTQVSLADICMAVFFYTRTNLNIFFFLPSNRTSGSGGSQPFWL